MDEVSKVQTAADVLRSIHAAVSAYRYAPFRSADWLAKEVMDALDGYLMQNATPNAETIAAMEDARAGRVTRIATVDELRNSEVSEPDSKEGE